MLAVCYVVFGAKASSAVSWATSQAAKERAKAKKARLLLWAISQSKLGDCVVACQTGAVCSA